MTVSRDGLNYTIVVVPQTTSAVNYVRSGIIRLRNGSISQLCHNIIPSLAQSEHLSIRAKVTRTAIQGVQHEASLHRHGDAARAFT